MAFEQDARVVVVDDDPLFVEAMLVLLPQLGLLPVACALDGAEAIAVAKEHAPDVVLVDLDTPLVDGFEAIKEISRASPKLIGVNLVAVEAATGRGKPGNGCVSVQSHESRRSPHSQKSAADQVPATAGAAEGQCPRAGKREAA
jgi:CheY-like chemotaxis protein